MRYLSYFYNLPWGILIAKNWGILISTYIGRIVNYYVAISLANEKLEPVEALGIDETSVRKGHNYVTVLTDLDRKKVVAVFNTPHLSTTGASN